MSDTLLQVKNLRIELKTRSGIVPVIDDLSFSLQHDESIAFVGESGCGKSLTALALLGLLQQDVAYIASGQIMFHGEDLTKATAARLRQIRGNEISMIFQEPMTSLNPLFTIGHQIAEVLYEHEKLSKKAAYNAAIELLDAVRIPNPKRRFHDYPFQMSGGQRQRVMIAIALACKPKILIADEPTTALDVTVQAQIFELIQALRNQMNTSVIMITHDMGVVAQMVDRMIVMYAGRKVEIGPTRQIIDHAKHPYTTGLISCVPHITNASKKSHGNLTEIPGIVPSLSEFGQDKCLFADRCTIAQSQCFNNRPKESRFPNNHQVACWLAGSES